ncbi:MAG TPA: DUF1727 domain-containing protein [Firmicutes bacterium]|nr:DUF1727 domain-containing protein [Bacillota bacterium]
MRRLRTWLAVLTGKVTLALCLLLSRFRTGWGGTSLPGLAARKVDPSILGHLRSCCQQVVLITGTNGKTTTTALLAGLLRADREVEVVTNGEGANMLAGITTALLKTQPLLLARRGRQTGYCRRVAVLEVDEGSLEALSNEIGPVDVVLVTNLFRDQLDRYTEVAVLANHMARGLKAWPDAQLVLNADDPVVASFAVGRSRVVYYGVAGAAGGSGVAASGGEQEANDTVLCPHCQRPLSFTQRNYSHLGYYRCPGCGFARPPVQYEAERLKPTTAEAGTSFRLRLPGEREITLQAHLPGLYNVYNMTAALATAAELGLPLEGALPKRLARFAVPPGRAERFHWPAVGKEATLILVKNPAGLSQALRTVLAGGKGNTPPATLVLAINDLAADGRDVSWLWDVDFSALAVAGNTSVVCSGRRAGDLAVCLKYHGVAPERLRVLPDLEESVRVGLKGTGRHFAVLCTYTNLAAYRRILLRQGGISCETANRPPLPRAS